MPAASKEKTKKQIPLRVSASLYNELAQWAEDDFRSINGQIEFLLTECVKHRKKNFQMRKYKEELTPVTTDRGFCHEEEKKEEQAMICTVTFNPSLDYIVDVKDFKLGFTNRTCSEQIFPGGKGINVSIVLRNLGISNTAFGFAAGFTGDEIIRRLQDMGVDSEFISVENGTSRINLKLKSIDGTEINGTGPEIAPEKVEELMKKLDRLGKGDVLFLAGSIPASMPDNMYEKIMERLSGRGVATVVDATGELLVKVLKYHPFLVKPNHHELGEIFGVRLHTGEEAIPYGKRLQKMGARNVLISMAGEGAVLVAENGEVYQKPAPKGRLVNAVGAGDSMVAGFMAGWMEKLDYRHAFYMGLAAGSASAFSENLATRQEIAEIYRQVSD